MGLTPAKRFSDGIMSSGFSLRWQRRRRRRRRRSAESLEWTLPRPPSSQSSPVFSQQTDSAASSSSYISTLRDTRAEAEIPTRALSTGSHLISSRFNLASIHLWPVTAANSLALSIEPQKWPTPIAFAMRPARRRGRSVQSVWVSVCEEGGGGKKKVSERERSDSTFLNCMSAQMYQKSLHGWIWLALYSPTLGNIAAKWCSRGGGWSEEGEVEGWRISKTN